jgi:hypothetical protein
MSLFNLSQITSKIHYSPYRIPHILLLCQTPQQQLRLHPHFSLLNHYLTSTTKYLFLPLISITFSKISLKSLIYHPISPYQIHLLHHYTNHQPLPVLISSSIHHNHPIITTLANPNASTLMIIFLPLDQDTAAGAIYPP